MHEAREEVALNHGAGGLMASLRSVATARLQVTGTFDASFT